MKGDFSFEEFRDWCVMIVKKENKEMKAKNKSVAQYWLEFYSDGRCILCGNRGELDTVHGTKTFCICPNGQALRSPETKFEKKAREMLEIHFKGSAH